MGEVTVSLRDETSKSLFQLITQLKPERRVMNQLFSLSKYNSRTPA